MSETSIRELLSRAVEAGPPPGVPLPIDDVLARNGRVLRHRRIVRASLAVVLLAGAAGLAGLLPGWLPGAAPDPPGPPAASRSVPTGPTSTDPTVDYKSRAEAAMALLTAAVPNGYTMPDRAEASGPDSASTYSLRQTYWREPGRSKVVSELYSASLEVQFDGRAAELSVRATERIPPELRPDDLCATRVDSDERECRVVRAANGTLVRIAGWQPVTGPVRQAMRVVNGVLVTVEQAGRPRPGVYGLGRPVLTDRQLAELVADPGLLP